MPKSHGSGNGNQMRHLIREGKSASKALQAQIDRAVALADKEIGVGYQVSGAREQLSSGADIQMPGANRTHDLQPLTPDTRHLTPMSSSGGIPVAPTNAVPPTPPPEPISVADYTERIRAGWVPVMGLPGTPITAGFGRGLGEYNPKLEGLNGIWTYQEMRRGDGQVAGTLRACKLPILSAQWQIKAAPEAEWDRGTGVPPVSGHGRDARATPLDGQDGRPTGTVSSTGAGKPTASKAKEVADFIRANFFSGL